MKIAISQPRYLPALNYLQRIHISDIFVILDTVQHQRRAYEHRNKIKSTNGKGVWCSIPLLKNSSRPIIKELKVHDHQWIQQHKKTIESYYKNAHYFDRDVLDKIYGNINEVDFVDIIHKITINICRLLNIKYSFIYASELALTSSNDKLLYEITKKVNGSEYLSGPNGRNYIDKKLFKDITLTYHEFDFPQYQQVNGEFIPWMSIVDQLFNVGLSKTKEYIFSRPVLKDN